MGIPAYWSLVHTTTAPTTLKPTLKQTRPTVGSIRRQPHIQRRPTYSDVVRNHESQAVGSFVPQRASEEGRRERERGRGREMGAERDGRSQLFVRLEANSPPRRLLGQMGEGTEDGGRHGERIVPAEEEAEESDEGMEDRGPNEDRIAAEEAQEADERGILPPSIFMQPIQWTDSATRASSSSSPSPVWDVSEYYSWISNPSTDPLGYSSVPGVVRHSPELISLQEAGYESTIVDEDSASEPEMATGMPFRRPEPMSGHQGTRRTMGNEEEWTRREHEALEEMRERLRIVRQPIARGARAEGEHGDEEEEEYLLQEYRRQYAFLD